MTTFERYFVKDPSCYYEAKSAYYKYLDNDKVITSILNEFGLDGSNPSAHIINGHMPVHLKSGETPIKCGGRVLMIDGGMSRPYQRETGIAGYTLVSNSYGMRLVAYEPFSSTEDAIRNETDIHSATEVVQKTSDRLSIRDTDEGRHMQTRIEELTELLDAYRLGVIRERITPL